LIGYRHADRRLPFLWEGSGQPAARWNRAGGGPVHYFADTPDGAWAEFLRHEEIVTPEDLATVVRTLWAVELPDSGYTEPLLDRATLTGGTESYAVCQREAERLAAAGYDGIRALSAALLPGAATGWRVDGGLQPAARREGQTLVLFGPRPDLVGWRMGEGRPGEELLARVRRLAEPER
jgi:hypothetical protein